MVGTGISGGWAAKELCEDGLRTLVLERGRMVKHIEDYPTMNDDDWAYPLKGELSQEDEKKYPIQKRVGWAPWKTTNIFFVITVVNKNNQVHNVPNGYVTDGAFMTSSNCVNPCLTYMAFTARAADHALNQLKAGKFA